MLKAANTATGSRNRRRKKSNRRLMLNRDPLMLDSETLRLFQFLALGQLKRGNWLVGNIARRGAWRQPEFRNRFD
jgi:hypothetical protein